MAFKILLVFCCVTALVAGAGRPARDRQPKLISFDNTKDDIEVSLDFTVPFLSIPIKKTVNSILDGLPGLAIPKINLNTSALAFGGFIILATAVLLPIFSKSFTYDTNHYYRVLDNGNVEANIITELTSQLMSVSSGCPPRIACWIGQRSTGPAAAAAVEELIRNKLVSSILNTSSVEEALTRGRAGRDCSAYEPCPLREHNLPAIMNNLNVLTSRNCI